MPSFGTTSTGNNSNWSHTVDSGSNLALIVAIGTHQGNISSVSWNGTSLTQIDVGHSAFNENGEIWGLLAPTPGTGTVAVSMSGGSWWGGVAINVSGVKQAAESTWTHANNSGSSGTASVSITPPSANCLLIAVMGAEADSTSRTYTLIANLQGQSFENASSQYTTASGNTTLNFGLSAGQRWGAAAVALEAPPTISLNMYLRQSFR